MTVSLEVIRRVLELPDDAEIIRTNDGPENATVSLLIESPDIPAGATLVLGKYSHKSKFDGFTKLE